MNAKSYYELLARVEKIEAQLAEIASRQDERLAMLTEQAARIATLERLLANATRSTGKKEAA